MTNLFIPKLFGPTYVLDTNTLIALFNYYPPEKFPGLWEKFYQMIKDRKIDSVREVRRELERYENKNAPIIQWASKNIEVFHTPTGHETTIVRDIYKVRHFGKLLSDKRIKTGNPVADPFIIARANIYPDML